MVLTRWNSQEPLSPYNLVLVQQSVAPFVESLQLSNPQSMSIDDKIVENPLTPEIIKRIQDRLDWAKVICENDWPPKGISKENQSSSPAPTTTCISTKVECHDWIKNLRGPLIFIPSLFIAFLSINFRGNKTFF